MLELLGAHSEGMALCELAQALRLPRSTAFNLAQTLTHLGYATPVSYTHLAQVPYLVGGAGAQGALIAAEAAKLQICLLYTSVHFLPR